jgi:hypothetical protein
MNEYGFPVQNFVMGQPKKLAKWKKSWRKKRKLISPRDLNIQTLSVPPFAPFLHFFTFLLLSSFSFFFFSFHSIHPNTHKNKYGFL